uniref:Uncharacterized protein n=1 Tax=Amphimedon queenslandica TaxID=400682 RepID=A0A1X7TNP8_AMPQE
MRALCRPIFGRNLGWGKLRLAAPNKVVYVSPIAIIPKTSQLGKYRLIVELSAPDGGSINDGISTALATLSYTSVDEAVAMVIEGRSECLDGKT